MRRIAVSIMVLLLLVISGVPVLADDGHQVIMSGSARQVEFLPGPSANIGVYLNTLSGTLRVNIIHPGGFGEPGGLWITGRYVVGEILDWTTDGSTTTINVYGQMYLLPSHATHGEAGIGQIIGELEGRGNRGHISMVSDLGTWFTIPGKIIVR
jgi:hypothetical protein